MQNVNIYSEEDKLYINRVVTLGGDGTILFAIKMFYNHKMPPVISFGLGSVGYLCCFDSDDYESVLYSCFIKKRKRADTYNLELALDQIDENDNIESMPQAV